MNGAERAVTKMYQRHCRVIGARLWLRSAGNIHFQLQTFSQIPVKLSLTHLVSICASSTQRALPIHTFLLHHAATHFYTSHSCTADNPVFFPPPPSKAIELRRSVDRAGSMRLPTPQLLLFFLGELISSGVRVCVCNLCNIVRL